MNRKGFSIVELLVAIALLFIVMVGFLRGILLYTEVQIRNQLKNRASDVSTALANYIRTVSFSTTASCDENHPNPFLCAVGYSYPYDWANSKCTGGNCTFEMQDSDSDGVPDFYDPYSGINRNFANTPTSFASWLRVVPCYCSGNSCRCCYGGTSTQVANLRCGERYKGRFIYVASTLASIQREDVALEVGRAVGLIVWYFDPKGNYKSVHSAVIRSVP